MTTNKVVLVEDSPVALEILQRYLILLQKLMWLGWHEMVLKVWR